MLDDYMETFRRMADAGGADGLGGQSGRLAPGESFQAALCAGQTSAAASAGAAAARESRELLHAPGVILRPGDIIRRESGGALYRVMSHSDCRRAPQGGRLAFAQVTVERVVGP